ncbi:hypothetical protein IQ06DRAFT_50810 [Phaeosphaeriaceae sp. SRC1lsM3a]|nr:hypothetical protein IQ06DRAFT_50810 [Stagonospora sp. SRC1lsM3a]
MFVYPEDPKFIALILTSLTIFSDAGGNILDRNTATASAPTTTRACSDTEQVNTFATCSLPVAKSAWLTAGLPSALVSTMQVVAFRLDDYRHIESSRSIYASTRVSNGGRATVMLITL